MKTTSNNHTNNGMITIPAMTLSALKSMLFNDKEGTDLSNIINDLSIGVENRDLTAIHIALTHKGIKPEIDTTTRYYRDYVTLYELEYIGYSQILGTVAIKRTELKYLKKEITKISEDIYNMPYTKWLELSTDRDTLVQELIARSGR